MSNGTDRLIGEIHAMSQEAKDQRAVLFQMLREVREQGCALGAANAQHIARLQARQFKIAMVGVALLAVIVGMDKVLALVW